MDFGLLLKLRKDLTIVENSQQWDKSLQVVQCSVVYHGIARFKPRTGEENFRAPFSIWQHQWRYYGGHMSNLSWDRTHSKRPSRPVGCCHPLQWPKTETKTHETLRAHFCGPMFLGLLSYSLLSLSSEYNHLARCCEISDGLLLARDSWNAGYKCPQYQQRQLSWCWNPWLQRSGPDQSNDHGENQDIKYDLTQTKFTKSIHNYHTCCDWRPWHECLLQVQHHQDSHLVFAFANDYECVIPGPLRAVVEGYIWIRRLWSQHHCTPSHNELIILNVTTEWLISAVYQIHKLSNRTRQTSEWRYLIFY